jgi:hypothetical protein
MTTYDLPDLRKNLPDGSPNSNYLQPRKMPLWEFYGMPKPPAMGGSGTPDLGTGRPPAALVNPNGPQPKAPATPAQPAPYTQPTAPSPGEEGEAKLAPAQFQAESQHGTEAAQQQATLGTMLADTSQFTTGPLAGIVGKVRNLAGNLGLSINTEAQSAKESFGKLAAGLANAQGSGSDSRMNVTISANPHEELSPAGVDLVIRQLQGNADYLQARAALARTYANRSDYNGFTKSIQNLDPRVFQLERMTEPQRTNYLKSLDGGAKSAILQSAQLVAKLRQAGQL